MKLEDFKIGETFWTGAGEWVCTDIGTRTVIAVEVREIDQHYELCESRPNLSQADPLLFSETVFNRYDFDGCFKTEEEYNQLMGRD